MRDSGSSETDNVQINLGLAEHSSASIKYPSSQLHFPSFTTALVIQVKQASFEQEVHDKGQTHTWLIAGSCLVHSSYSLQALGLYQGL
jgi:hypothetical protein